MKKEILMKRLLINKQIYKAIKYQVAKTIENINCENEHNLERTLIFAYKVWPWVFLIRSIHRLAY